ncbi:hypothetical protein [Fretibacter rubidus]|uniref:hypothetical protein n=1 Tax=Fretibacter rubidus TaxID=570162 RepID=UPI00352A5D24
MLSKPFSRAPMGDVNVDLIMDMMLWSVKTYGPCVKPQVPNLLKKNNLLPSWDDNDETPVFQWAMREFERILIQTNMTRWRVQLLPDAVLAGQYAITPHNTLRANEAQNAPLPSYHIDKMGRPIFYYDPRECHRPGYLLGHIVPKLAQLKLFAAEAPREFQKENLPLLLDVVTCHMGQGLANIALIKPQDTRPKAGFSLKRPPCDRAKERLLFATVLALSSRRLSPEQIIAHYGPILSKSHRKAIWPICKTIEKQSEFIKLLRVMTDNRFAERSLITPKRKTA